MAKKTAVLKVRVDEEFKALVSDAARAAGADDVSEWARRALREAARRELGRAGRA